MPYKIPESVLVVIHTEDLRVLILERADHPGFWQSVTGSKDAPDEPLAETARREVQEETGIDARQHVLTDWNHCIEYTIYERWRYRYAPGVMRNTEHWFGLCLPNHFPEQTSVLIAPREHLRYVWLDYQKAAEKCFSPSNATAILRLARQTPPSAPL